MSGVIIWLAFFHFQSFTVALYGLTRVDTLFLIELQVVHWHFDDVFPPAAILAFMLTSQGYTSNIVENSSVE